MRWLIASLGLVGCAFNGRASSDGPPGDDDAPPPIDAFTGDGPNGCTEWVPAPQHFDPCAIPAPGSIWTVPQTLSPHTYDTDADTYDGAPLAAVIGEGHTTIIVAGGVEARLVSVDELHINSNAELDVVGSRGLIVAAWTQIDVDGVLDASSTRVGGRVGAGANPALCNAAVQGEAGDTGGGSGGGGGGGFQANGGIGGDGDSPPSQPGGAGGQMTGASSVVRGGCAGAPSGVAGSGVTPEAVSAGGAGGGAIQLTAREEIRVAGGGRVRAGGAGGQGAPIGTACGGGGGGSGGYLGFDAPMVRIDGRALANGGGGGASQTFAGTIPGDDGDDAQADDVRAAGGTQNACAPPGGLGSGMGELGGSDGGDGTATQGCGGGGGGGAAGYIRVWSTALTIGNNASISPAQQ